MTAHATTFDALPSIAGSPLRGSLTTSSGASWLEGRCSGRLLYRWRDNLQRRFGEGATERVRARLGGLSEVLPDAPSSAEWLPVSAQLAATSVMLDELYGGDVEAMYQAVREDTARLLPPGSRLALRALGLRRVFGKAPGLHRRLYDVGHVSVEVGASSARMSFRQAPMFEHPTWQLLQRFAVRMLLEMMGRRVVSIEGATPCAGAHDLTVTWR